MQLTCYAQSIHDLGVIKESGLQEVILGTKELSRIANNAEFDSLAQAARDLGLKVILEWDILITESEFTHAVNAFKAISPASYDVVRVQDAGVLNYVLEFSDKPIQFIAETGNRNIVGLQTWKNLIGDRLDRMVLSLELNHYKLREIKKELNCPLEILGAGPILLFYSPRKLLRALVNDNERKNLEQIKEESLKALGESQESPHKGFPLIENRHGTFMFHIKDLFIFDKLTELMETGIDYIRVDFRQHDDLSFLPKLSHALHLADIKSIKSEYPKDTTRGYFQVNKTDVLFNKLKNYRIQRKDEKYIGEVMEILKGDYVAIQLKSKHNQLKVGDQIKYITPEGKELNCQVFELRDTAFEETEFRNMGQIALVNYMGGVWPKSQVYQQ